MVAGTSRRRFKEDHGGRDAESETEIVDTRHRLYDTLQDLRAKQKKRAEKLAALRATAQDRAELYEIKDLQNKAAERVKQIDCHLPPQEVGRRDRSRSPSPWQNRIKFQSSSEDEGDKAVKGKKKAGVGSKKAVEGKKAGGLRRAIEAPAPDALELEIYEKELARMEARQGSRSRGRRRRKKSRSKKPPRKSAFTDDVDPIVKLTHPDQLLPTYPLNIGLDGAPGDTPRFGKTHLYLTNLQARILVGRGGCNIQKIMRETMAQIHVNSPPQAATADVSIAGNIQPALVLIRELLLSHGCPISDGTPDSTAPGLLSIPDRFMGALVGAKAGLILHLQDKYGKDLIVQQLGYKAPDGGEMVQVVGPMWKEAKVDVEVWLEQRKAEQRNAHGPGQGPSVPQIVLPPGAAPNLPPGAVSVPPPGWPIAV